MSGCYTTWFLDGRNHEHALVRGSRLFGLREECAARARRAHSAAKHAGRVWPHSRSGRRGRRVEARPEEHFRTQVFPRLRAGGNGNER